MGDKRFGFEKVSFDEYVMAYNKCFPLNITQENEMREQWEGIKLPKRATSGSAGYDFFSPMRFYVPVSDQHHGRCCVTVPTGIKIVGMPKNAFFMMMPKSGIGFKTGVRLSNTVGVIDSDYEGQIMVRFEKGRDRMEVCAGDKFVQGVFMPFLITSDDEPGDAVRGSGGFGSTGAR